MSVNESKVKCEICNKFFSSICFSHLQKKHNLTFSQYKSKFPKAILVSMERRNNISKAGIERYKNEEERIKTSLANKGQKRTSEQKNNIRKAKLLSWKNPEYRNKMIEAIKKNRPDFFGKKNPFYGKKHSLETKKKIGIKISNNKCLHDKQSKTMLEGYKLGRIIVWNKGKTKETDSRIKKYGKLGRITRAKHIYETGASNYNIKGCVFFNEINEKFGLNGFHARNKGEYYLKDLGFFLDYYEPSLNLVIEWNEGQHYNRDGTFRRYHIDRQLEIKQYLNCIFININQKNFEKKKELIINKIKEIVINKTGECNARAN